MIRHLVTFLLYVPCIWRDWYNWPGYLANYLLRRTNRTEYRMRNGVRLVDGTGTLTGTIAVVFVRREYGQIEQFKTIVDIGAHVGSFAVYAAQSCPEAHIYCYEPERVNFSALRENIRINGLEGRVSTSHCAVASTSGSRDLVLRGSLQNTFHMAPLNGNRQTVKCTTLRDIFRAHDLDTIDLLKVNCEGSEYEILEGCSDEELSRIAHIRLEYHNLDPVKHNGRSLSSLLEGRGFTIDRFTNYRNTSGFIWAARPIRLTKRVRLDPRDAQLASVRHRRAGATAT